MPSSAIIAVGRRPPSLSPFAQTLLFSALFALLIQLALAIEYDGKTISSYFGAFSNSGRYDWCLVCPEESSALIENGTEYQCSSPDDPVCTRPYTCDNSTSFCCGRPLNAEQLQPEVDDAQSLLVSEEEHTRYCGSEGRVLRGATFAT